jgi:hypothetical protein
MNKVWNHIKTFFHPVTSTVVDPVIRLLHLGQPER